MYSQGVPLSLHIYNENGYQLSPFERLLMNKILLQENGAGAALANRLILTFMNQDTVIKDTNAAMQKAVDHTIHEFSTLNTGKANPSMVESLIVKCYDSSMKMLETFSSSISAP